MDGVARQLEILGLEETLRRVAYEGGTHRQQARQVRRIEAAHELLSELPAPDDLSFLHSGLCQTSLPHSRPPEDHTPWTRRSGRFSLMVQPGVIDSEAGPRYVGVPYGPKARLILIYLQTEGIRSRTVNMGASLSAFMRSLGLSVTGGKNGSIKGVREQSLRLARCAFTMQWSEGTKDGDRTIIADTRIVDRLELWRSDGSSWANTVELSPQFHEHLREHAVPLDRRGIAMLSGNSLALDLYALFAYRLPRIEKPVHLRWTALQDQIGTSDRHTGSLASRIRDALPEVLSAYPGASVDVTPYGISLKPSPPAVPKTQVRGVRLVGG